MGKHVDIILDVFSIFSSPGWIAEGILTVPQSFTGNNNASEFIRVSILASGGGLNLKSSSGIILIQVFTAVGSGPMAAAGIADKLDSYLVGKSFGGIGATTQITSGSSFVIGKEDEVNPMLLHSTYQVQFNHFHSN